ncbi:hypothetical protein SPO0458 [Ruegeria pomeroyi DSS-3]|uniref:Uncharacterized protein n=1 Tax=Ruegeria pomeroyi (strain ATCC 700808 / DSM 15171 / DSS-3) TaxID=246200 RepID=Q5LW84_RUEPO|nr:hypothetical protein SPO0458 [Ruegeria pomeroyi DSS-3]
MILIGPLLHLGIRRQIGNRTPRFPQRPLWHHSIDSARLGPERQGCIGIDQPVVRCAGLVHLQPQGVGAARADPMIGVPLIDQIPGPIEIQPRETGVDPLGPVDVSIDRAELVAGDCHAIDEMANPMRLDHDIAEPGRHLARQKDIVGDAQRAERESAIEVRVRVLFVSPFQAAIVDIVLGKSRARVSPDQYDTRCARPVVNGIALKEVVAQDHMVLPRHDGKMTEPGRPAMAQLDVVGIGVEPDAAAVRHVQRLFRREKLAPVDQHALTATTDRGDSTILWPTDKTIVKRECSAVRSQPDRAAMGVTLELDVLHVELRQRAEAAEIQHVFEAAEGEDLGACRIIERRVQCDLTGPHVFRAHIDFAPDTRSRHQGTHRNIGDIRHVVQLTRVIGVICRLRDKGIGIPSGTRHRHQLPVADHPSGRETGPVWNSRLHVDRRGDRHIAPAHVQRFVIRPVQQRLKRLAKGGFLVTKGRDIGRKIKILGQQQHLVDRHRHRALEIDLRCQADRLPQEISSARHENAAPSGCAIGGLECGRVVGDPIAHRTVITDIDLAQHVTQERAGDIGDLDIVDPHDAAIRPFEIEAEMTIERRRPPDHVDTAAIAGSHDARHLDHIAIAGQRGRGPLFRHAADMRTACRTGPPGDPNAGQVATDRLDPDLDLQVTARLQGRLPHIAQLLNRCGLLQFQAAAKIGIRRNKGRIRRPIIGIRPRRAVAARPHIQPQLKGGRHEVDAVGDCLVHTNPFPNRATDDLPARFHVTGPGRTRTRQMGRTKGLIPAHSTVTVTLPQTEGGGVSRT